MDLVYGDQFESLTAGLQVGSVQTRFWIERKFHPQDKENESNSAALIGMSTPSRVTMSVMHRVSHSTLTIARSAPTLG